MITNDVQYRNAKAWLARFESEAADLAADAPVTERTRIEQLQIDAALAQAADLRRQVDEYEVVRSGSERRFEATSLLGLADALIKARLARRWSQRQLAERLGIAEQQVQRYEATGYASASLARLADVADALGVTVTETVTLADVTEAA